MSSNTQFGLLGLSFAAVVATGTFASASVSYPGPFVGTTVTYTDVVEASGNLPEDPEPLYDAPTGITGDVLDFDPTADFVADAPPTDTTDGSLSFTMTSNTGLLSTLVISEAGSYAFAGADNDELVAATLQVQILDVSTSTVLDSQQSVFLTQYDTAPSDVGNWTNSVTIDLTPYALSEIDVVINNVLQTTGVGPGTAMISKTEFKVSTSPIPGVPEPASAALLLGGLGATMLRRRLA